MTDNRDERGPGGHRPGRAPGRGGPGRGGPSRGGPDRGDRPLKRRPPPGGPVRPAFGREAGERPSRSPEEEVAADVEARLLPTEERIAKVIARAGIASRRDAEAMIEQGRVTLNGKPVASPALNVGQEDRITVDGEPLPLRERTRLWLFHKPRGLVTTFRDPQGRPTVFEALPEEMPRVVAIGRLDMNTEGLLLLTNDGGLAKVIAQPETGWTRRYRVRAFGDVAQSDLDKLRAGITIDGTEYGAVEATLDRVQGDNSWLTLALREGKNREVKRILEHLGLQVNRLIRLSFGPFQLGELESGLVEEVRTKVLKDQLGTALATEAGVDFASPVREPIAPFGRPNGRPQNRSPRVPDPRRAAPDRPGQHRLERRGKADSAWRDTGSDAGHRPKPHPRRDDPHAERMAGETRRARVGAIEREGRRVLVERVVRPEAEQGAGPPRRGFKPGREREAAPRPREERGGKPARQERGDRPGRPEAGRGRFERAPSPGGDRGFGKSRGAPGQGRDGATGRGGGPGAGPPRGRPGFAPRGKPGFSPRGKPGPRGGPKR